MNKQYTEEMRNDIKCYSPSFEDAVSHKGFNKHSQSEESKEETGRVVGVHYNNKDLMNRDSHKDQNIKQTIGKVPLSNLMEFSLALEEVSRVREYGKKKYPLAESWRQVPDEDLDSAILRHMFNKNIKDDETGYSHKAHMIANLMFELQKEMEKDND